MIVPEKHPKPHPIEKRRKRQLFGRSHDTRKLMLYLYVDEYELLCEASIRKGLSMSGYICLEAINNAKAYLSTSLAG